MERIFRRISELEATSPSLLFTYFQSCYQTVSTYRRFFLLTKFICEQYGDHEFPFDDFVEHFPNLGRRDDSFHALNTMADNRLVLRRSELSATKEHVYFNFSFRLSRATVDEYKHSANYAPALFDVVSIIEDPIRLYALNKALSIGRVVTHTLVDELVNFVPAPNRLQLYSYISHKLEPLLDAEILDRLDRGIFVPDKNYDATIQVFSDTVEFYENQWKDYNQRSVSDIMNVSDFAVTSHNVINAALPDVLRVFMFLRKHAYFRLIDFPIIVTEESKPIGYITFNDVAESALRLTFEGYTDRKLSRKFGESEFLVRVDPVDPACKFRDVNARSRYVPLVKDEQLGYVTKEDMRFIPNLSKT